MFLYEKVTLTPSGTFNPGATNQKRGGRHGILLPKMESITMNNLSVGIFGSNGHQIHGAIADHPRARLVAAAAFPAEKLADAKGVRQYDSLDALLKDAEVQLVSLCSPRRREQAREAIRCLEAGKHVLAEKPCAMTEADLDAIVETSRRTGCAFHEMAGTAFGQPYRAMAQIVRAGTIGQVVQVFAQKSYPYYDNRPQNEEVDGGLVGQNATHGVRLIEQVAGQQVAAIQAMETQLGNPKAGDLRMAAGLLCRLANGGLASVIANYLNPRGLGIWGNDHLRIFGTLGMVEATDGGTQTRLVVGNEDRGPLKFEKAAGDCFFEMILDSLLDGLAMPLTLEQELHPTRIVIRAVIVARQ